MNVQVHPSNSSGEQDDKPPRAVPHRNHRVPFRRVAKELMANTGAGNTNDRLLVPVTQINAGGKIQLKPLTLDESGTSKSTAPLTVGNDTALDTKITHDAGLNDTIMGAAQRLSQARNSRHASQGKRKSQNRGENIYMQAPRIVYKEHSRPVYNLGFVRDERRDETLVLTGSEDKTVRVWSLVTGKLRATLTGHVQRVSGVVGYCGKGYDSIAASCSWDETVRIWPMEECYSSTATNETKKKKKKPSSSLAVRNSGGAGDVIERKENEEAVEEGKEGGGGDFEDDSGGDEPEASDDDDDDDEDEAIEKRSRRIEAKSIKLTGFVNRALCICTLQAPNGAPIIAAGSSDNTVRIWSIPRGEFLFSLQLSEDVTWNLCIASWYIRSNITAPRMTGPVLITGCRNHEVRVWRLMQSRIPNRLPTPPKTVNANREHTPAKIIHGHTSAVHSLSPFESNDEPMVATVCRDYEIRVFSLLTGNLLKMLRGHKNTISAITAHDISTERGGAIIVSSSVTGNMRVWKYTTGELLRTFTGHTEEITTCTSFATPDPKTDDLIIVSASKDCTARTWLFAEEKLLRVLKQGEKIRINAVDVYAVDSDPLIVTGADDGKLRAWRVSRTSSGTTNSNFGEEGEYLEWIVDAHKSQISALVIYIPNSDYFSFAATAAAAATSATIAFAEKGSSSYNNNNNNNNKRSERPSYLSCPLVISGSRDGSIRISDIETGEKVCPMWQAHSAVLTSLVPFAGIPSAMRSNGLLTQGIDPFVISGSEDDTANVWSLMDNSLKYTLSGHIFDVTAVHVYLPKPVVAKAHRRDKRTVSRQQHQQQQQQPLSRSSTKASTRGVMQLQKQQQDAAQQSPQQQPDNNENARRRGSKSGSLSFNPDAVQPDPILITASMDNTVILWAFATGEILDVLDDSDTHITSLGTIELSEEGPVIVGGDGSGDIRVWSLTLPSHDLLRTLRGHADEVSCLHVMHPEGVYPVLVSGSLDRTIRVWDLSVMKHVSTLEGHSDDITCLKMFCPGGADACIVSGSIDATTRVLFDFLGNVPNVDVVLQMFQFDLEGTNAHILDTKLRTKWPRISKLAKVAGNEAFFGQYYTLFGLALRKGRSDFLQEFLPTSVLGLLKSNQPEMPAATGTEAKPPKAAAAAAAAAGGSSGGKEGGSQLGKLGITGLGNGIRIGLSSGTPTASRANEGDNISSSSSGTTAVTQPQPPPSGTNKVVATTAADSSPMLPVGSTSGDAAAAEEESRRLSTGASILGTVSSVGTGIAKLPGIAIGGGLPGITIGAPAGGPTGRKSTTPTPLGGLLRQAIDLNDTISVRTIVDCWCAFLTTEPVSDTDLLYDPVLSKLSMADMILLADKYPAEFEQLICEVKLMPMCNNTPPEGAKYMYTKPSGRNGLAIYTSDDGTGSGRSGGGPMGAIKRHQNRKKNNKDIDSPLTIFTEFAHSTHQELRRLFARIRQMVAPGSEGLSGEDGIGGGGGGSSGYGRGRTAAHGSSRHGEGDDAEHFRTRGEIVDLLRAGGQNESGAAFYMRKWSHSGKGHVVTQENLNHTNDDKNVYEVAKTAVKEAMDDVEDCVDDARDEIADSFEEVKEVLQNLVAKDEEEEEEEEDNTVVRDQTYLYLPLENAIHMDMLKAYITTCKKLNSVQIFRSEAGELALGYAWRSVGIRAHLREFTIYLAFATICTISTVTFEGIVEGDPAFWFFPILLILTQFVFDAYFINKEKDQMMVDPVEYFTDVWNMIDFQVIFTNILGNLTRLSAWKETLTSRVIIGYSMVFVFFNILYFLRAFEATGPLVSMIAQIIQDMKYLMVVLGLVLLGFAQAFWLVSNQQAGSTFGRLDDSLQNSFSFMLGGYDPTAFDGLSLRGFGNMLSAAYMIVMSVLLLNLLIALMGDSYGTVKEKGLAQWKYEQAQIITEMQGSMEVSDTQREDLVIFRTNTEDLKRKKEDDEEEEKEDEAYEQLSAQVKALTKSHNEVLDKQDELIEMVQMLVQAQQRQLQQQQQQQQPATPS